MVAEVRSLSPDGRRLYARSFASFARCRLLSISVGVNTNILYYCYAYIYLYNIEIKRKVGRNSLNKSENREKKKYCQVFKQIAKPNV